VSRTKSVGLMLLLMIPGAGVPMPGSAEAAPPELSAGTVVGIPDRASVTVPVGAEEILANGDVVVHPLAATAVDGTTFNLTGPLTAPTTRNPDGSVPLELQVTGAGVTKVFNLNALPPDATHTSWRWSRAPDTDLVAGHSDAFVGTRLSNLSLDMAHAAAAPRVRATTDLPAVAPRVTVEMRRSASEPAAAPRSGEFRAAPAESGMNCNSSTWTARYPAD
jgi:hypothetical protein